VLTVALLPSIVLAVSVLVVSIELTVRVLTVALLPSIVLAVSVLVVSRELTRRVLKNP
jgi:hypothetical protein